MQRPLDQAREALRTLLIQMGSTTEKAIQDAIASVLERRPHVARAVLDGEARINAYEIEVDDVVVDTLALRQPVAADLRFILAVMKINNDLERIGDHAVNIAESALTLASLPSFPLPEGFVDMSRMAETMLRRALDGFIHAAPDLCREVLRDDDVIDDLNRRTVRRLVDVIRTDPSAVDQAIDFMRVSRNLERVADLATNIAEEVIYMAEAQVVKHRQEGTR
jgi:phosphate transport system protein